MTIGLVVKQRTRETDSWRVGKLKPRLIMPLTMACFYLFALIREMGTLIYAWITGTPYSIGLLWSFLLDIEVVEPLTSVRLEILRVLSGPLATLSVGYGLLFLVARSKASFPLAVFAAVLSYLCLILDPAYFGLAGLLAEGGEPDQLALNGLSKSVTAPMAIIILVINVFLIRKLLMPHLRRLLSR